MSAFSEFRVCLCDTQVNKVSSAVVLALELPERDIYPRMSTLSYMSTALRLSDDLITRVVGRCDASRLDLFQLRLLRP